MNLPSYNIICQDAEDVIKETASNHQEINTTSQTYVSQQQQQQHNKNKTEHCIFFLFLGLCFTLCFSFILCISIHNHHTTTTITRVKSDGKYLKHEMKVHKHAKVVFYDMPPLFRKRNEQKDYGGIHYKPLQRFYKGRIIHTHTTQDQDQGLFIHNEDDDDY